MDKNEAAEENNSEDAIPADGISMGALYRSVGVLGEVANELEREGTEFESADLTFVNTGHKSLIANLKENSGDKLKKELDDLFPELGEEGLNAVVLRLRNAQLLGWTNGMLAAISGPRQQLTLPPEVMAQMMQGGGAPPGPGGRGNPTTGQYL